MRTKRFTFLTILMVLCLLVTGCATTKHYKHSFKIEGKEYKKFKDLDDEQALQMVVMFYNVPEETYEDGVARGLTLEMYMEALEKRKSEYLKSSGVFDLAYKKVELKTWDDQNLVNVYDALEKKVINQGFRLISELSERESAVKIVRLTGMNSIVQELKNRQITREAWGVAAQLLTVALQVALTAL
jgi:hypothetical protein